MQHKKSGWAVTLAARGGHRECVRLLQDAGWPSQRVVTAAAAADQDSLLDPSAEECPGDGEEQPQLLLGGRGREDGRKTPSAAEDGPGEGEEGRQMLLKGCGRDGAGDTTEGRRCSSLLDEDDETSTLTDLPAEGVDRGGEEHEQQHTHATPPACAQLLLRPTTAEISSRRRHSFVAARTPSARGFRPSGRVLSMDMALPGLLPEGAMPSYLQELLEAPVLHTPRQHSNDPAGGKKEQFCDRSTTTSCSTVGAPSTTPAHGFPQGEGVGAGEGPEGFCLQEWQWFSEGANGVGDRSRRLGAEEAFAVGNTRSRVRDVWSPVCGAAGGLEVRSALFWSGDFSVFLLRVLYLFGYGPGWVVHV